MAIRQRFGIGEWYGRPIQFLSNEQRGANAANVSKSQPCPFKTLGANRTCTKAGGVCTLQKFSPIRRRLANICMDRKGTVGTRRAASGR